MTTTKASRLFQIQHLLLAHPEGLKQSEIARHLGAHRSTIMRDIIDLTIVLPIWEDASGRVGIQRDDYLASYGLDEPKRIATELETLIARGESELLEFKVAACWNSHRQIKDAKMVDNIVETVAGFMNSLMGGVILIGVADDGQVIGLADDYRVADVKKQDRDGYELFLRNALNDKLGGDSVLFYEIRFFQIHSDEVCRVKVKPASKPVYFRGSFYVRNGNQTRRLTTQEAVEYMRDRWKE